MTLPDEPPPQAFSDSVCSRKYNASAYRALFILLALVRKRSLSLDELNRELIANDAVAQAYDNETIVRYINTLRLVGCEIPRPNSRDAFQYALLKNPFPLPVTSDEACAARRLLTHLAAMPDESLYRRYERLLRKIAWSLPQDVRDELMRPPQLQNDPDGLARRRALAAQYRDLCRDEQALVVSYAMGDAEPLQLAIEPLHLEQSGDCVYLLAYDRANAEKIRLNLEKILCVRQLPVKCERRARQTAVAFRLSGRLVKSYRPYGDERVSPDPQRPDCLLVRTRVDDVDALLRRLLKYGELCEVLSPAAARRQMRDRIQRLREALAQPISEADLSTDASQSAPSGSR